MESFCLDVMRIDTFERAFVFLCLFRFLLWSKALIYHSTIFTGDILMMIVNEDGVYLDIDLMSFRQGVDALSNWPYITYFQTVPMSSSSVSLAAASSSAVATSNCRKAIGVRLSCAGDVAYKIKGKYGRIDIPLDHPIFSEKSHTSPPFSIPNILGIPLRVIKVPYDTYEIDHPNHAKLKENDILQLFRTFDPNSRLNYGHYSEDWRFPCGSVLVARDDGKNFLPLHLEALLKYTIEEVSDSAQSALRIANDWMAMLPRDRAEEEMALVYFMINDHISRYYFQRYWERFKKQHGVSDHIRGPFHGDMHPQQP
jgi:hypothetical protein